MKIVIVEDDSRIQRNYRELIKLKFGDKVKLIQIETLTGLEDFSENGVLNKLSVTDVIVMDACMSGDEPDTIAITRRISDKFDGIMIANSGSPTYRKQLLNAGCNLESPSKTALLDLLEDYIPVSA